MIAFLKRAFSLETSSSLVFLRRAWYFSLTALGFGLDMSTGPNTSFHSFPEGNGVLLGEDGTLPGEVGTLPDGPPNCFLLIPIARSSAWTRAILFFATAEALRFLYVASTSARFFPGINLSGGIFDRFDGDFPGVDCGDFPGDPPSCFLRRAIALSKAWTSAVLPFDTADALRCL